MSQTRLSVCLLGGWHYNFIFPPVGTLSLQDRFLSHPARNPSAIENAVNTFSHKLLVQEAAIPTHCSSVALCTLNEKEAFR